MRKHLFLSKIEICLAVGLILFYGLLRLLFLSRLPVFLDEGIYIRWAQIMRSEPALRFLPLQDGKQPLFMWSMIPFLKLIPDPLVAGRVTSVFFGLLSLFGIWFLAWSLFNKKIAFWSALVYILSPLHLFFDRMALVESLLAVSGVWSLFLAISLVRAPSLGLALLLGASLGVGLLTKSSALFFVYLVPLVLLIMGWKTRPLGRKAILILVFGLLSLAVARGLYQILWLGPGFEMIALRGRDYVLDIHQVMREPFGKLQVSNLKNSLLWLGTYLTPPLLLACFLGLIRFGKQKERFLAALLLFSWFLIPLLYEIEFSKVFLARYVLSISFPLLIFSGGLLSSLEKLRKKSIVLYVFLLVIFLALAGFRDLQLIVAPSRFSFSGREREYVEGTNSGYGVKEIAFYLREQARQKNVVVGVDGFFGVLPEGLNIYLDGVPNIVVVPGGPVDVKILAIKNLEEGESGCKKRGGTIQFLEKLGKTCVYVVPESLWEAAEENSAFLVINDPRSNIKTLGKEKAVHLVSRYSKFPKGEKEEYIYLFEVKR